MSIHLWLTRPARSPRASPGSLPSVRRPGWDESEWLRLAASLEQGSEHPLAAAITQCALEKGLKLSRAEAFQSQTGLGIEGKVDGRVVAVGSSALVEKVDDRLAGLGERAEDLRRDGQTVVFVVVDGRPAGLLGIADPDQGLGRCRRERPEARRPARDHGDRR